MSIRRTVAAGSAALLLAASLAACSLLPGAGDHRAALPDGTEVDETLAGTSWSGVDSDGDAWGLAFQPDGSIGLGYNGDAYDDATDVWGVVGGTLHVHVVFTDGAIDLAGPYPGAGGALDLDGRYDGGTFTLALTED